jgi:hypothetical protein
MTESKEQKPQWTLTREAGKVVWRIPLPVYEGKALVLDLSPQEADRLGKKLQDYAEKCRAEKKLTRSPVGKFEVAPKKTKAKPIRAPKAKGKKA